MTPAFDSCPLDETRMLPIKQLLSLQFRTARLPFVKECLVGRFEVYQAKFASSGIDVCPTWKKDRVVNLITATTIDRVAQRLPQLPAADTGRPLPVLELLKENSLYTVSLDNAPGQKGETPGSCAAIFAGGFPGF